MSDVPGEDNLDGVFDFCSRLDPCLRLGQLPCQRLNGQGRFSYLEFQRRPKPMLNWFEKYVS